MDKSAAGQEIQGSRGIGPARAKILARLGLATIRDSLYYLPDRYEDRINISKIGDIGGAASATVKGRVVASSVRYVSRGRFKVFELAIDDGTGRIRASWFNQPFMKRNFRTGDEVILCGAIKKTPFSSGLPEMQSPDYEHVTDVSETGIHTNRIVPFYRLTEGIGQKQFRRIIHGIVERHAPSLSDPLPDDIRLRHNLPPLSESIRQVHFPDQGSDISSLNSGTGPYHRRLSFDELFFYALGLAAMKKNRALDRGISFDCEGVFIRRFIGLLPFSLTLSQSRVIGEILADMKRPYAMNRLLQGDVGSGKTVVAAAAMLQAVECGYQAVLMAPTEILAEQHYMNIRALLGGPCPETVLLSGGSRNRPLEEIASGAAKIVVGTHALIQEGVEFGNLGLIVIDEQHKFGVGQRASLRKKGLNPDVLVMTATPIPRSLALTLYGDLDCSVMDGLPPRRRPVITEVAGSEEKGRIYGMIEKEVSDGRQVYIVYPAIEESDYVDMKSAVRGAEAFQKIFPSIRFGLIHGRMDTQDRDAVMASFKKGETDVLVSTTVIEVGVDVPNATLMLIINAERFGLAQLHQLRGRVGRGDCPSRCLLVVQGQASETAGRRLDIMVQTGDGFRIAEEDLAIRGPGEFFGERQAGMPDFKAADLLRDLALFEEARSEAFSLIDISPGLEGLPALRNAAETFWQGRIDSFRTG